MRGITFSQSSIDNILNGSKQQTRRVVATQSDYLHGSIEHGGARWVIAVKDGVAEIRCPFGKKGDGLYIKEDFSHVEGSTLYRQRRDKLPQGYKWKSPRWFPRAAARLHIVLTSIRVERLQDITVRDIKREGPPLDDDAGSLWRFAQRQGKRRVSEFYFRQAFQIYWDSINLPRGWGWNKNPLVWVLGFKLATREVEL